MPRSALVLPALAAATALVVTGVVGGVVAPAAGAATPHGRSAVDFHTTDDHHVVAPSTTRPGIAHLRNTGSGDVFVAEARRGTGNVHQLAKALRVNSPKPFLKDYRLVSIAPGHTGSYDTLTPGTYYFANVDTARIRAHRIRVMTVAGSPVDARTPRGRGLVVTSHRNLRLPGSIAREGYLHVQNHSSSLTDFLFVGVDNSETRAMLAQIVAHPSLEKVVEASDTMGDPFLFAPVPAAGPHSISWTHYHGRAGRYLVAMIAFDPSGHGSHLHPGQVRVLTLT